MYVLLGDKHLEKAAYHPKTSGQAERFNTTLLVRFQNYVAKHQKNWDTFVQPLTNTYKCKSTDGQTEHRSNFSLEDTNQDQSSCYPVTQYNQTAIEKHYSKSSVHA